MTSISPTQDLYEPALELRGERIRFPALDGLRGLAALAVVTTHVAFQTGRTAKPGPVGYVLARGDFGVAVFFLLSGFLLYRPLVTGVRRGALGTYLRRRALRILPVYWLAVVVAFVLLPENHGRGPREWVTNLLLLQTYPDRPLPAGLTQMWSLCAEVAFYAALPLFAWWLAGRRARRGEPVGSRTDAVVLVSLVAVGWLWTALAAGPLLPGAAHLWLPGYADWFAFGMALAVLHHRVSRGPRDGVARTLEELASAPGTCVVVAVLLFLLAATPLGGPKLLVLPTGWEAVAKHVLYGLSACWLLLPAVFAPPGGTPWTRLLSSRPLHLVGLISYSLFALHLVVLHVTFQMLGVRVFTGHFTTVWLVTVVSSLAVAAVSYRLVERPAQERGRRGRVRA